MIIDTEKYRKLIKHIREEAQDYRSGKTLGRAFVDAEDVLDEAADAIGDLLAALTPPNEWVKVMEAINNAAVAYIEGGPYENDLPGMEFALKIDRLSRDFVRPPEGKEDTKDVHMG